MSGPAEDTAYDVIVIGAGPIGQVAALRTRAAGLTVALVERELVGGECSYWACIPSKGGTGAWTVSGGSRCRPPTARRFR